MAVVEAELLFGGSVWKSTTTSGVEQPGGQQRQGRVRPGIPPSPQKWPGGRSALSCPLLLSEDMDDPALSSPL